MSAHASLWLQQASKVLANLMTAGTTLFSCRHIFSLRTPRIAGGLLLLTGQFLWHAYSRTTYCNLVCSSKQNQYRLLKGMSPVWDHLDGCRAAGCLQ